MGEESEATKYSFSPIPSKSGLPSRAAMMVSGYPAGSVNRTPFPNTGPSSNPSLTGQNGGPAMSRGHWSTVSNIVFNDASCVNVAAICYLNISTRELTVDVEAYYTNTSTNTTNKINVALIIFSTWHLQLAYGN